MPPRGLSTNSELNQPVNKRLREDLLGKLGYGVPVRLRGYTLVGHAVGRLARLYQRNDHPDAKQPNRWLEFDYENLPVYAFPDSFWVRFFERCGGLLIKSGTWNRVNTWYPKPGLLIEVYKKVDTGEYLHIPKRCVDSRFDLLIRSDATRMRVTNSKAEIKAREKLTEHLTGRQKR